MCVYVGSVESGYSGSGIPAGTPLDKTYGIFFILGWVAAGVALVGSTVFWMVVEKLQEYYA